MWNVCLRRGTIWSVKSINQYEQIYEGMTAGTSNVLILTAFQDEKGLNKFTYIKAKDYKKPDKYYKSIKVNDRIFYLELENILTGDQRALDNYIGTVDNEDFKSIISTLKDYFNLHIKRKRSIKPKQEKIEIPQQRIYKFGINVYVTENEHVKVNSKKQIILTKEAKDDIIYNSQTDDQIRILCDKYKIYPLKAIKEIRNRLIYQHKQNEG